MITWRLSIELIQVSRFRLITIEPQAKERSITTGNNFCHSYLYKEIERKIDVNSICTRNLHQVSPGLVQAPLREPALVWAQTNFVKVHADRASPPLHAVPPLIPAP